MKQACPLLFALALCACHGGRVPHIPILPSDTASVTPLREAHETVKPSPNPPVIAASHYEIEPRIIVDPPLDAARLIGELNARLQDVFFALDSSDLAPDALAVIQGDADMIKTAAAQVRNLTLTIEGHCDERGSAEYNLALGDRRARRAADALHDFAAQLPPEVIVSYGKEAPQCTEPTESCWQRNRRAHLVVKTN